MRTASSTWLLAFLFALAPVQATELAGLWLVRGSLPDGTAFTGQAVLVHQSTPGVYTIRGQGRVATGESFRWGARAERSERQLSVRHWRNMPGFLAVIPGGEAKRAITGSYLISADGCSFEGRFEVPGQAEPGTIRYECQPLPKGSFEPASLSIAVGSSGSAQLQLPAELLELVDLSGADEEELEWELGEDGVVVFEGLSADRFGVRAHLGPGGPVLAELELVVSEDVLERVLEQVGRVAASEREPIVIFDLDDTLFDTRQRALLALREFADREQEPRLARLELEQIAYRLEDILVNAGLSPEEIEGPLGKRIDRFFWGRFFAPEWQLKDGVTPGGPEYLTRLAAAGARVAYVTGRKESTLEFSRRALAAAGYPTEDQLYYFKPARQRDEPRLATEEFKGAVARELAERGVLVAAFDNEPANCNAFRAALGDDGIVVFLDTRYEPDAPPLEGEILVLTDFR